MNTFTKKTLCLAILFSIVVVNVWADRGTGKKNKTKTTLNIATNTNIKNAIAFNVKSGLTYKGLLLNSRKNVNAGIMNTSLITYQKGNITYILPYKNKITLTEVKPGYTGMKLIIRKK